MADLRTNRQTQQVIQADDINDIARAVNGKVTSAELPVTVVSAMAAAGYAMLKVVADIGDIPSNAPTGSAFLVLSGPVPEPPDGPAGDAKVVGGFSTALQFTGSVSSVNIATPAGTASGDVMVAVLYHQANDTTVPWDIPSGWTKVSPDVSNPSDWTRRNFVMLMRTLTAAPATSYEFSRPPATNGRVAAALVTLRGVKSTPVGAGVWPEQADNQHVTVPSLSASAGSIYLFGYVATTAGGTSNVPPTVPVAFNHTTGAVYPDDTGGAAANRADVYTRKVLVTGPTTSFEATMPQATAAMASYALVFTPK